MAETIFPPNGFVIQSGTVDVPFVGGATKIIGSAGKGSASPVVVKALASNTTVIVVGGNVVTPTPAFTLAPGESVAIPAGDPTTIYMATTIAGQKLTFLYIQQQ